MLSPQLKWTYFAGQASEVPEIPATMVTEMPVSVYPKWFKEITVSWIPLEAWLPLNPTYNIYRGSLETGEYDKLNTSPLTELFFKDETTTSSDKFSEDYYIVEVTLDTGGPWKSHPTKTTTYQGRWVEKRAVEINRREWILLSKFTGIKTTIVRARTGGLRCPDCWDEVSRKMTQDKCTSCYGTSWEGGYYRGFNTYVQYDARVENYQHTYFGKFEANQIGAWAIAYPDLQPHDILIRHDDFRVYRVEQIQNTELRGNVVRHIMRITELAKQDIEHALVEREGLLTP